MKKLFYLITLLFTVLLHSCGDEIESQSNGTNDLDSVSWKFEIKCISVTKDSVGFDGLFLRLDTFLSLFNKQLWVDYRQGKKTQFPMTYDDAASYDFFREVEDSLESGYFKIWDTIADEKFGKEFVNLDSSEAKFIKRIFPYGVVEGIKPFDGEPRNLFK